MARFTIRDLLLITVIVAVGVGWWLSHRRYEQMVHELRTSRDTEKQRAEKYYAMVLKLVADPRKFPV